MASDALTMNNMENLQVNQQAIIKPKFTRSLFKGWGNEKYWCYRKKVNLPESLTPNDYYLSGYYCYHCKNELFFQWETKQDNPPFKVHGVLLTTKQKTNEYGQVIEVNYFQAYCCKCAIAKLPIPFKCDCQEFIIIKQQEYAQEKQKYLTKLGENRMLIKQLEDLANKEDFKDENCYINERLSYFISIEKREQAIFNEAIASNYKFSQVVEKWETSRNHQLTNHK